MVVTSHTHTQVKMIIFGYVHVLVVTTTSCVLFCNRHFTSTNGTEHKNEFFFNLFLFVYFNFCFCGIWYLSFNHIFYFINLISRITFFIATNYVIYIYIYTFHSFPYHNEQLNTEDYWIFEPVNFLCIARGFQRIKWISLNYSTDENDTILFVTAMRKTVNIN